MRPGSLQLSVGRGAPRTSGGLTGYRKTFYGSGAKGYTDYPDRHQVADSPEPAYALIEQSRIGVSLS
jgi:hypothetical protein